LNRLVTENYVDGWDDPHLMTLAGLRRRGVTSTAIHTFLEESISQEGCHFDGSMIRLEHLEHHVRDELNKPAPHTIVVLHPLKVVITNLEPSSVIDLDAKKWLGAPNDDASSCYKVLLRVTIGFDSLISILKLRGTTYSFTQQKMQHFKHHALDEQDNKT
ncbi:putative glutamine--tRNA ligase, partial [Tanacetum coccineum]